ncbi:MAG TPA: hypothetical protein VIJ60_03585, partial [Acidimicrobiales bacterium]
MFKSDKQPEGRPLSGIAVATIRTEHSRRVKTDPTVGFSDDTIVVEDGRSSGRSLEIPAILLAYKPDTGRYVGAPSAFIADRFGEKFPLERHVLIEDNHLPTSEELERIRVLDDGTVLNGWLRRPPPPPVEKPGPSADPGVPLPDRVLEAIVVSHDRELVRRSLEPLPAGYNPVLGLAFSVADGRFVGCTLEPQVAENAHLMVV